MWVWALDWKWNGSKKKREETERIKTTENFHLFKINVTLMFECVFAPPYFSLSRWRPSITTVMNVTIEWCTVLSYFNATEHNLIQTVIVTSWKCTEEDQKNTKPSLWNHLVPHFFIFILDETSFLAHNKNAPSSIENSWKNQENALFGGSSFSSSLSLCSTHFRHIFLVHQDQSQYGFASLIEVIIIKFISRKCT